MADYNDKGGPWVVHDKPLRSSPDRERHAGLMPVYAWRDCIRHLSTNDGSVDEKPDLLVACETAYCSTTGSERHRREARSRSISAWRRLLRHLSANDGSVDGKPDLLVAYETALLFSHRQRVTQA
jgi:hypothetical protein